MVQSWVHNQSDHPGQEPELLGQGQRRPDVDTINMPIIQTDTTVFLDFQKGTIDYSTVPSGQWRATLNSPNVKSGKWTAKAYPSTATYFISINMSKPLMGSASMLPIRQALNYGADRTAVCNVVREGVPIPDDEFIPTTIDGYQAGLNPYPSIRPRAPRRSTRGKAANGGKNPPVIPYWYNTGTYHGDIAQALTAGWNKLGLQFKLSGLVTNAYWTTLGENKGPGMVPRRLDHGLPVDRQLRLPVHDGRAASTVATPSTATRPSTRPSTRLARRSTRPSASALYNQAAKIAMTDAPCVPIFTYRDARVTNNRIGGFNYNAGGLVDMNQVWVRSGQ